MTSMLAVGPSGLTEGALLEMLNDEVTVDRPVLQIVDLFTVYDSHHSSHERWQFMLNDGRHTFSRVMLSSDFALKKLVPYSIITIEGYDCLTRERKTANGHAMRGLIISKASIKVPGHQVKKLIGDPKSLEDEVDGKDSDPNFKVNFDKSMLSNPRKIRQATTKRLTETAKACPPTVSSVPRPLQIYITNERMDRYGKDKFQPQFEKARQIPGVITCEYDRDLGVLHFEAEPQACEAVWRSLALRSARVQIAAQCMDHFRKAESLRDLAKVSGCSVDFNEELKEVTLMGVFSELNAAELLLEEQINKLKATTTGKSKKKNKSKNNANTTEAADASSSKPDSKAKASVSKPEPKSLHGPQEPQIVAPVASGTSYASEAKEVKDLVSGLNESFEESNIVDCVVCLTERPTVAFVPCGHRHTCPACAKKIFEGDSRCCPTCREEIERCIRIWT